MASGPFRRRASAAPASSGRVTTNQAPVCGATLTTRIGLIVRVDALEGSVRVSGELSLPTLSFSRRARTRQ